MARKELNKCVPKNIPDLEEPCPICPLTKATRIPRGITIDVSKSPPGFMLQIDFAFSMLGASVDLPRLLWLYVLLIHNLFGFHTEVNGHLLTSSDYLSLH